MSKVFTRILVLLSLLTPSQMLVAQSLPLDFESLEIDYNPVGFPNTTTDIVANPEIDSDNESATVWNITKLLGSMSEFGGAEIALESPIDFSTSSVVSAKFWSQYAGVPVKMKIEDLDSPLDINNNPTVYAEVLLSSTVSGGWETLMFDMSTFEGFDAEVEYENLIIYPDYEYIPFINDIPFYFDDIQTEMSTNTNEVSVEARINSFPNPANDVLNIEFTLPLSGKVVFELVNPTGQIVQSVQTQISADEVKVQRMDIDQMAAGMYVLVLRNEGKILTQNNIVIK